MRYLKWTFWIVFWALFASFLHYTLPQHDVVRIVNTEVRRVDFGENSIFWAQQDVGQDGTVTNRDVRFIEAFYENDRPMVYRNEDTGWGWPPYFKLDSSNLQAEARDAISTKADPEWVVIRHYGWRNEFLSIFPNAVSVRPIEGPDVRIIPWVSIIVWTLVIMLVWFITARWIRFKRRRISPALDSIDASLDQSRAGVSRWLDSWRSKPPR